MADLFGDWIPDEWIEDVFAACAKAPQHRYLFLTKNPRRYINLASAGKLPQGDNMWYGTTVVSPDKRFFWSGLHHSYNTFVSIEPLLIPFDPNGDFTLVDWVIVGAESGNRKDKVTPQKEWIETICEMAKYTPIFMKDSLIPIVGEENMRREFPWKTT